MGSLSIWHWLIFLVVALLLFGGSGKISSIMGDVAKGIKSFKKGMSEDDSRPTPARRTPSRRKSPRPSDSRRPRARRRPRADSPAQPGRPRRSTR